MNLGKCIRFSIKLKCASTLHMVVNWGSATQDRVRIGLAVTVAPFAVLISY